MDKDFIKFLEKERERLAGDLHDSTVQNLTHVLHKLEIISKYVDDDPIQAKLELNVTKNFLKETIRDMRNIIYELRPMSFDDLGFCVTVKDFVNGFTERYHINFELQLDDHINQFSEMIQINILRVIQEFCINVAKHATAEHVIIQITIDDTYIHLFLKDDGIGCDLNDINDKKHFGLNIMKQRILALSGTLNYITNKNEGFILDAFIPI